MSSVTKFKCYFVYCRYSYILFFKSCLIVDLCNLLAVILLSNFYFLYVFFPSVCPMITQNKSILIDLMIMYNLIPLNFLLISIGFEVTCNLIIHI